jgi:site-specific recombinase XerD
VEFKRDWAHLCRVAGMIDKAGRPSARVHDLRHTYASVLVSSGQSLPIIGALLGHTQPATTARYAHLFDDPLRQATERVGAVVSGKPAAEVIPYRRGG